MTSNIHVCSVNVKGLRDKQKRYRFYEWTKNQKCNLVFIQETHFDNELEKYLATESEFNFFFSHGNTCSRGVAILINKNFPCNILETHKDSNGRILLLNIEIENNIFTFVNLYAPNIEKERNIFFKNVNDFINKHAIGSLVVAGDMNDALTKLDRKSNYSKNDKKVIKPVNSLKVLIKTNDLIDVWRNFNPEKRQFTWRRLNPPQASRIDMFFTQKDLMPNIQACDIRPIMIKFTDHQAISLKIQTSTAKSKGPGYWKLNNSILNEENYLLKIEKLIDKYQTLMSINNTDIRLLWDALKIEIKEFSIQYCKNKSKFKRNKIQEIEKKLKELIIDLNENKNRITSEQIEELEIELEQEYEYKSKGAQIRSKEEWCEKGEKNNKYFLGLEKSRQNKKTIIKLRDENDNIVTEQEKILKIERKFYQNLYSNEEKQNKKQLIEYVKNCELQHKLTENESNLCDGYISLDEITFAVNNLKLNKSPGLDGLSTNFYRKFWNTLGPILVKVYNASFDKTELPFSQRQSILNLLYKKNDPLDLSNYRPISLLNTDYKILSYTLASRIKKVLTLIINADQTGYIRNRYIGFNLRQIQDIIDYADRFNVEGAILFIDFSKAFDTLQWDFMFQTLKHFGFNEAFINWIKTLYSNINSSIVNNGWISAPISPQRGIRQGCPCSSIIFVIAVEIMANYLRKDTNIKGIEIKLEGKAHNLKISQLADDTTLFLKSKYEIEKALNIIEIFGNFSGLKLNKNKTEGIWIGKLKHCKDKVCNVSFTNKPVKVLGLYVGINKKECDELNWSNKIEKIKNLIKSWEKRNLTLIGKILIVKTLIIPQFTYIASVTHFNQEYIKMLEKEIYKFIWNNKPDKVKRTTMIASYEKGGLNMIDINSYFKMLKIKWVLKLVQSTDENWSIIPKLYLNKLGKNLLVFKMNIGLENLIYIKTNYNLPKFYDELLTNWVQIKNAPSKIPTDFRNIRKQIIWGNRFIKLNNNPIILSNWINSNIIYINDIIDENGDITEKYILDKLKNKTNWMTEFVKVKKAIPKEWIEVLKSENSIKTKVNINKSLILFGKNDIDINELSNKQIYISLISGKIEDNIGIKKWEKKLNVEIPQSDKVFKFIHEHIIQNNIKMFKWKLISNILPTQENLYTWHIVNSPFCKHCGKIDNYQHFLIECTLLKIFWEKVYIILKLIGFSKKISLQNLVLGYKINDYEYWDLNLIFTLISFSIYKVFYISEQRSKVIDIYEIFKKELITYVNVIEKLKKTDSNLLIRVRNILRNPD